MEALGMIETRGLLAAIESADAMMKAAEVRLLERTFVGGGLVTITITGDVAAVKASIDAAAAAVNRLGAELLVSQHLIPRPHSELGETIISPVPLAELHSEKTEEFNEIAEEPDTDNNEPSETAMPAETDEIKDAAEMHKDDMDRLVAEKGIDKAVEIINRCKVVKLRNLAREYKDFGISGRDVSKANKTALIEEFRKYYS